MAQYIENHLPVVKFEGLNTQKPVTMESTLAVAGVATFTVAPVFTANPVVFTQTDASAATIAVTAAMTGGVFFATKGSATQTYTLPAIASGLQYTFVCGDAAGEILINPTGSVVFGVKASEGGAAVTTAAGTGVKNTALTNVLYDRVTLTCNGVGWFATQQSGIWASQ